MTNPFGVEHISKEAPPWGGARWGPNATPAAKKKSRRRNAAAIIGSGAGGAAIGGVFGGKPGLSSKQGKVGAALAGTSLVAGVGGNLRDKKRGVALTGAPPPGRFPGPHTHRHDIRKGLITPTKDKRDN